MKMQERGVFSPPHPITLSPPHPPTPSVRFASDNNHAPDMDYWSLKEKFFGWVVSAMADMCIAKALAGRYQFTELTPSVIAGPTI